MQNKRARCRWWLSLVGGLAVLAGCSSPTRAPAPLEDRTPPRVVVAPSGAPEVARVLPGAENAGKPGYFTVRPGDTLIRIALENGQNWRDVARWNNLDNPNLIEVGQVIRVAPPGTLVGEATARPIAPPAAVASAPLAAASAAPAASAPRAGASTPSLPVNTPPVAAGEEDIAWSWPTAAGSSVLAGFDEQKNKGIDIGGRAGDPVLASADGRVVYAGAGLRGYGNLIILKHNNTYLTAYAHNQALLVREDQSVSKGQKIAEMGSSDADRVKLHFEIRRQGKPVDPTKYLPPR
ncbi:peptidoglycan DD-metalloendopeptidase family protein [Ramlibacter sp.]|uniref:peptidoglycan DD-metalloendopeptidase family protein n=1 Tax=Ramlibacter sp. TaxID=1917967 RepID=UPI003D0EDD90